MPITTPEKMKNCLDLLTELEKCIHDPDTQLVVVMYLIKFLQQYNLNPFLGGQNVKKGM